MFPLTSRNTEVWYKGRNFRAITLEREEAKILIHFRYGTIKGPGITVPKKAMQLGPQEMLLICTTYERFRTGAGVKAVEAFFNSWRRRHHAQGFTLLDWDQYVTDYSSR